MTLRAITIGMCLLLMHVTVDAAAPGDSGTEPAPVGHVFQIEDWSIAVTAVTDRRTQEGTITARIEATNMGEMPAFVTSRFRFGIVGADGLGIQPDDGCSTGASYEGDPFFTDVFPSATAVAELCWSVENVALQGADSILMFINVVNPPTEARGYYYVDLLDEQVAEPVPLTYLAIEVGPRYLADVSTCQTRGFYGDVASGRQVLVLDAESGAKVFTTLLGDYTTANGVCTWTFMLPAIEERVRYEVRTPNRHLGWFSREDADASGTITVSIGT